MTPNRLRTRKQKTTWQHRHTTTNEHHHVFNIPMCRICKEDKKRIKRGIRTMDCVEFTITQKQQPSGKYAGGFHDSWGSKSLIQLRFTSHGAKRCPRVRRHKMMTNQVRIGYECELDSITCHFFSNFFTIKLKSHWLSLYLARRPPLGESGGHKYGLSWPWIEVLTRILLIPQWGNSQNYSSKKVEKMYSAGESGVILKYVKINKQNI